jgi:WD40 region of Ge1, enhancer of mRNA-decapping protein
LHIEKDYNITSNIVHRVVWCPYIPDGTVDKEVAELLVLTSGQKAEMWCVPMVTAKHGAGPLKPEDVTDGILRVPEFEHSITDAAFSPDGSAIAIATAGGLVSFFQVVVGEPLRGLVSKFDWLSRCTCTTKPPLDVYIPGRRTTTNHCPPSCS